MPLPTQIPGAVRRSVEPPRPPEGAGVPAAQTIGTGTGPAGTGAAGATRRTQDGAGGGLQDAAGGRLQKGSGGRLPKGASGIPPATGPSSPGSPQPGRTGQPAVPAGGPAAAAPAGTGSRPEAAASTATPAAGAETADSLLARYVNRYLLPRVALTVISLASLVGVYLTLRMQGVPPWLVVPRWSGLVGLGILAGGCMWWSRFVVPQDTQPAAVARLAAAQARHYRPLAAGGLAVALAGGGVWTAWMGPLAATRGWLGLWLVVVALHAGLVTATLALLSRPDGEAVAARRQALAVLATATGLLAGMALLDAALTFGPWWPAWVLRPLHLGAFGLWLGGAVWNIFVAVPAARDELAFATVAASATQLERFRQRVRVFLPLLLLTGIAQAAAYAGWNPLAWTVNFVGRLALVKLGLVAALFVIFITCPLWRACSPIKGMCDLEELAGPAAAAGGRSRRRRTEPAPATAGGWSPATVPSPAPNPARTVAAGRRGEAGSTTPGAVRRLDRRGSGCAGFVHVDEALAAMAPGEVLELLSSDPISWWELPGWLEVHGHRLLFRERRRIWPWRYFRFLIQRGGAGTAG